MSAGLDLTLREGTMEGVEYLASQKLRAVTGDRMIHLEGLWSQVVGISSRFCRTVYPRVNNRLSPSLAGLPQMMGTRLAVFVR